jgi:hypothetical protein
VTEVLICVCFFEEICYNDIAKLVKENTNHYSVCISSILFVVQTLPVFLLDKVFKTDESIDTSA